VKTKAFPITFFLLSFIPFSILPAQMQMDSLKHKDKKELIKKIGILLSDNYVFPDLGKRYRQEIVKLYASGEFDKVNDPKAFGDSVTAVLQKITKDKHILFRLVEKNDISENNKGSLHHPVRYFRLGQKEHLGIFRLDWIDNEIGYMDYRRFYYHHEAKEMLINAIQFLSSANAIIIDLRENQGGSGLLIPLLCSYFLPHPTQLTGTYYRGTNITQEWWTLEQIKGKRLLDVPMFLVIGKNTFSAAEYLAYDLKVQKRAILIGEATKGGAHSVDLFPVGDRFEIYIPTARAVNPVTGSNWEGTGVIPDILVSTESALDTTIILAKKAAQEYEKLKDDKIKKVISEMQRQLDQAESEYREGNNHEAKSLIDTAFQTGSHVNLLNEFFIQVLAYHYGSIRAHKMATGILKMQIELFPKSQSGYESLAWSYYQQGEKRLAIEYFEKVLELDTNNTMAKEMLNKLKRK
jgi:tetratricopeptide (TPR) repeat protein